MHIPYPAPIEAAMIAACHRLQDTLTRLTPHTAARLRTWQAHFPGGAEQPWRYFQHPQAFPMFLLPYWMEQHILGDAPTRYPDLHTDLAYSNVAIYYYIRLLDDVIDDDPRADTKLIAAAAGLHTQWHGVFHKYFPHGHPFWVDFTALWHETNDLVLQEADATAMSQADYLNISGQKVHGAKIPLIAVNHLYDRMDVYNTWMPFYTRFAQWHQMINDVIWWLGDFEAGRHTYFMTEAHAQSAAAGQSVPQWVASVGFDWALALMNTWYTEAYGMAQALDCPPLLEYLRARRAILNTHAEEQRQKLFVMGKLLGVLMNKDGA
jgi:hypothetical protein